MWPDSGQKGYDWLALPTGGRNRLTVGVSYPQEEESTSILIFPQAVVHMTPVTTLPDGVFVYSIISEDMNTTISAFLRSVLWASLVEFSGRAALGTIFSSDLAMVGWMGLLSSLSPEGAVSAIRLRKGLTYVRQWRRGITLPCVGRIMPNITLHAVVLLTPDHVPRAPDHDGHRCLDHGWSG